MATGQIVHKPDAAGTNDTFVVGNSSVDRSSLDHMVAGVLDGAFAYGFVKFLSLPSIPSGSKVASAFLRVFAQSAVEATRLQVMRLSSDYATEDVRYPGPDVTGDVDADVTIGTAQQYYDVDVTTLVRGWYAGTIAHYGVRLGDPNNGTRYLQTSDAVESQRPALVINWSDDPPSAPGAFTAPTSGQRLNGTNTVAWGAASDPEGATVTYYADLSLDGGSTWTNHYSGTGTSFSFDYDTVAASNNAQWRVRAHDPAGQFGPFTHSASFQVNKAPAAPGAFTSPATGATVDTTGTVEAGAASDPNGDTLTYQWDLSVDNGATWTTRRPTQAGLSFTYDYTNEAATTAATWRVRAYDGVLFGPYTQSGLFTIEHNTAPTAPTPTDPVGNATRDRTKPITLRATFNDTDSGDTVSESQWRTRVVNTTTWATVTQSGNLREYQYPAGHFAAGDYEWQALYKDAAGAASPWSVSEFFKAATPPAGPSITSPTDGATVPQNAVVAWTSTDQAAFRVRRVADAAGVPDEATVYYDSGRVVSASARNHPLTYETNNRTEHVQVQVESAAGLLSTWASVMVVVSYTPPPVPSVVVVPEPVGAQHRLLFTNDPPNLLPNDASASFEDGTTGGWTASNVTLANSGEWAAHGTRSLQLTPTAAAGAADSFAVRSYTVGAGVTLTFSATARLTAALSGALDARTRKILVYSFDSAGAVINKVAESAAAPNAAGETRLAATGTTPANTASVQVRLYHGGGTGAGDVWWDAVQVEEGDTATAFHLPSAPDVLSNSVYRREVGGVAERIKVDASPGGTWVDRTPGHGGQVYEYQVEAVGDNGTTSLSPWTV